MSTYIAGAAPALATGALLIVVMVKVAGRLSPVPSLTIKLTSYVPALSGVNVGLAAVELLRVAVLPNGLVTRDHA